MAAKAGRPLQPLPLLFLFIPVCFALISNQTNPICFSLRTRRAFRRPHGGVNRHRSKDLLLFFFSLRSHRVSSSPFRFSGELESRWWRVRGKFSYSSWFFKLLLFPPSFFSFSPSLGCFRSPIAVDIFPVIFGRRRAPFSRATRCQVLVSFLFLFSTLLLRFLARMREIRNGLGGLGFLHQEIC